MNFKIKKHKHINSLDSGAMSDLAFLLIVFFIVIAVFNINAGFLLGLPKKHSSRIVNTQDIVRINVHVDGIFLDANAVTLEGLEVTIKEKIAIRPNMTVFLVIDPEVKYQKVINLIDMVRACRVENFSFKMRGLHED